MRVGLTILLGMTLAVVFGSNSAWAEEPAAETKDIGLQVLRAWSASKKRVSSSLMRSLIEDRNRTEVGRLPARLQPMVGTDAMTKEHIRRAQQRSDFRVEFTDLRAIVAGAWASASMAKLLGFPASPAGKPGAGAGADIAGWLRPTRSTSFIEIDASRSKLVYEQGNGLAQSGRPEAGEWLEIDLALAKRTELPLFSTSVFGLRTTSDCAWTPPHSEIELNEFNDGQTTPIVRLQVWISEDCASEGKVGFTMDVGDSGWRNSARESLSFEIRLDTALGFSELQARLESDLPGSSRGANQARIGPGHRYELSVGVNAPNAVGVTTTHHFGVGEAIFMENDKKPFPWSLQEFSGKFIPTNDHDFEVVNKTQYRAWLMKYKQLPWMRGKEPELLVAVDVLMAKERGEPQFSRENGLYLQRGYVLLPLEYVSVPRRAPPPRRRVVKRKIPAPDLDRELEPEVPVSVKTVAVSAGVHLLPVSVGSDNGALAMGLVNVKLGRRLKGVVEFSSGDSGRYSATDFLVGGRLSLIANQSIELGPYMIAGSRTANSNFDDGYRVTWGNVRFGFSTEIYFAGALGLMLDVGLASERNVGVFYMGTVGSSAGLVLGF